MLQNDGGVCPPPEGCGQCRQCPPLEGCGHCGRYPLSEGRGHCGRCPLSEGCDQPPSEESCSLGAMAWSQNQAARGE